MTKTLLVKLNDDKFVKLVYNQDESGVWICRMSDEMMKDIENFFPSLLEDDHLEFFDRVKELHEETVKLNNLAMHSRDVYKGGAPT